MIIKDGITYYSEVEINTAISKLGTGVIKSNFYSEHFKDFVNDIVINTGSAILEKLKEQ